MLTKPELEAIRQELERMIDKRRKLGEFDPNARDFLALLEIVHVLVKYHLRSMAPKEKVPRKRSR